MPVVVLVNQWTASAAEIIAGALQDNDRAVVVGLPTFGKGLVQSLFNLGDGRALKLTTARWFTPSGRSIQRSSNDEAEQLRQVQAIATGTDSIDVDSLPVRHTVSGRIVHGGGGIVPDRIVRGDTLTDGEKAYVRALGGNVAAYSDALVVAALEIKERKLATSENFTVTDAMRQLVYAKLASKGVTLTDEEKAGGQTLLDDQLGYQIARYVFGRQAELRRSGLDDQQVREAVQLLRAGTTPARADVGDHRGVIPPAVAVVGGGRVGLSLARALADSGGAVAVLSRSARPLPAPLAPATVAWEPALAAADLVIVAVPDDAVATVALRLRDGGAIGATQVVLHASGSPRPACAGCARADRGVAGLVPSAPDAARSGGRARTRWPARRRSSRVSRGPLAAARALAERLGDDAGPRAPRRGEGALPRGGGLRVELPGGACRRGGAAGPRRRARGHAGPLPAADAPDTGPSRRRVTLPRRSPGRSAAATSGTVRAHLEALDPESRALYAALGREALDLAAREGLDRDTVGAIRKLLG